MHRSFFKRIMVCMLVLLAPRSASAWCRTVSEQMPKDFPQDKECFHPDGALPLFWKNACTSYDLQQDASGQVTLQQATESLARAFAAWSTAECEGGGHPSISAADLGPVECASVQYNESDSQGNQHVIIFRDDGWPHEGNPFNTLGFTRLQFDKDSGEIVDADMELNSSDHLFAVEGPPKTGEVLLDNVVLHEVGHFLGLAHSQDPSAVMYALYNGDSSTLAPDDVAGICGIYPPNGQRLSAAGPVDEGPCDGTPKHGFARTCDGPPVSTDDTSPAAVVWPIHHNACAAAPGLGQSADRNWLLFAAALGLRRIRRRTNAM